MCSSTGLIRTISTIYVTITFADQTFMLKYPPPLWIYLHLYITGLVFRRQIYQQPFLNHKIKMFEVLNTYCC